MDSKKIYPFIHFAPKYGWINDPNGLVFHDGVYELYFQHNPYGIEWGNMTWGHARSKDLLHWEELEPVLRPDENGFMYSGCGIRNEREALKLPKDALIFFYTAALHNWLDPSKTRFTIRLAYSLDGGNSLVKTGGPVLESLYPDNRDPKVFWHEESRAYVMVLWLQNNDFGIFRSEDLEHFCLSQRLTLDGGYECPDLFELPVYDSVTEVQTGREWIFWTADGSYYIGDFDGYTFMQKSERQKANAMGSLPYAAQTFFGTDQIINMAWICTKCIGLQTTGAISLPRALSLIKKEGKYLLRQRLPVVVENAFLTAGNLEFSGESVTIEEEAAVRLLVHCEGDWTIDFYSGDRNKQLTITYRHQGGSFIVTHREVSSFVLLGGSSNDLDLIYDKGILEISAENGVLLQISDVPELRTASINEVMLQEGNAAVTVMLIQ